MYFLNLGNDDLCSVSTRNIGSLTNAEYFYFYFYFFPKKLITSKRLSFFDLKNAAFWKMWFFYSYLRLAINNRRNIQMTRSTGLIFGSMSQARRRTKSPLGAADPQPNSPVVIYICEDPLNPR
jgi:hypothetical protein